MLEKEMQNIGLSEKQAKIYLVLLDLGGSSVQKISQKSGVKRATVYVILNELIKIGLASTYSKEGKTFYLAESPERLNTIIANQIQSFESKKQELSSIMPQLNEMCQKTDNQGPKVEFFTGQKDTKKAIKQALRAKKNSEIDMFYDNDKISQYFSNEERGKIRELRQKRGIKTKVIYTSTKGRLPAKARNDERVKISEKKFPTKCDITLYDDKVQIASLNEKDLNGIIITDKSIRQSFSSLFKLAWIGAKKEKINS